MEKLQDLKKRLDAETDKYEDGEGYSASELIGVGYELIELVEEQQKKFEELKQKYTAIETLFVETLKACNENNCTPHELSKLIMENKVDFTPFEEAIK